MSEPSTGSIEIRCGIGSGIGGVSVPFFCAVEKCLRRLYPAVVRVDCESVNRWVRLLGQVETEYRELAEAGRKKP